jgi:type I restriction enzyme S subunit
MYGATAGKIAINKIPLTTNQACCNLTIDETIADYNFVYYCLRNSYDELENLASGAAQQNLNVGIISDFEILLPSLPEQHAIASVLSSLDDKIDLLNRENQTLEQMAEALFRQWFIEEADEEWEEGKLGDVLAVIESGKRPKGGIDPDLENGIPSIGAENINGIGHYDYSKTKLVNEVFFQSMKKGIIKDYDVLIYKDGAYVGRKGMFGLKYPYDICTVNEHVFILRANDKLNQFFLYFILEQEALSQLNSNSAQPGLNQETIKSLDITIPPKVLVEEFSNMVKPWIDKILINAKQIRTLEKLRDTLLPKLMSGEVRVKICDA